MTGTTVLILLCALLAATGAYLAWRLGRSHGPAEDPASLFVETFPAEHPRYVAMVRQALSEADARFLALRVAPEARRRARAARRHAALEFLALLRRDFRKLDQLGRALNCLLPETAYQQEWRRLRLSIHFELLCGLVWLKLQAGQLPDPELRTLANRVGGFASRLEAAMHAWQEASLVTEATSVRV
jgi:hypothetical protein